MRYLSLIFAFLISFFPLLEAQQANTNLDVTATEQERLLENRYIMDFRKAAYESMMLTEKEIENFDPLYDDYMSRKMDILDERFRLMNDYRSRLSALEQKDRRAEELTADFIENYWETQIDEMQLKKNYFARFENVVSNVDAITFFMLEERLQSEVEEASLIEIVPTTIEIREYYIPLTKDYYKSSSHSQKSDEQEKSGKKKKKMSDHDRESSYNR